MDGAGDCDNERSAGDNDCDCDNSGYCPDDNDGGLSRYFFDSAELLQVGGEALDNGIAPVGAECDEERPDEAAGANIHNQTGWSNIHC